VSSTQPYSDIPQNGPIFDIAPDQCQILNRFSAGGVSFHVVLFRTGVCAESKFL